MKKVLLDTDVIVDFLRNGIDDEGVFHGVKEKTIQACISVITMFELYNGALLSNNPKQKLEDLAKLLEVFHVISFDKAQSYVASKSYAYLVKKGYSLEMRDILIAACAIANNLRLLTRNKKHFARIPELVFFE